MFLFAFLIGGGLVFAAVDSFAGAVIGMLGVGLFSGLALMLLVDLFVIMGVMSSSHPFLSQHLLLLTQAQLPITVLVVSAFIAAVWRNGQPPALSGPWATKEKEGWAFPIWTVIVVAVLFAFNMWIIAAGLEGFSNDGMPGGVSPYVFSQYGIDPNNLGQYDTLGHAVVHAYVYNSFGLVAILMSCVAAMCGSIPIRWSQQSRKDKKEAAKPAWQR